MFETGFVTLNRKPHCHLRVTKIGGLDTLTSNSVFVSPSFSESVRKTHEGNRSFQLGFFLHNFSRNSRARENRGFQRTCSRGLPRNPMRFATTYRIRLRATPALFLDRIVHLRVHFMLLSQLGKSTGFQSVKNTDIYIHYARVNTLARVVGIPAPKYRPRTTNRSEDPKHVFENYHIFSFFFF